MDTSLWVVILGVVVVAVAASVGPDLLSPLAADFTIVKPEGDLIAGAIVSFEDTSRGRVIRREWDFGDGSPTSSLNPASHTYCFDSDISVTYRVRLTVWGRLGRSSTVEKPIQILPAQAPRINSVTGTPDRSTWSSLAPLTTLRLAANVDQPGTPTLKVTSYTWTLVRRGTREQVLPMVQGRPEVEFTLAKAGTYDLLLTVENNACRKTSYVDQLTVVPPGPVTITTFSAEPTRSEFYPTEVTVSWSAFHRYDTGTLKFAIDWGDGTDTDGGNFTSSASRRHRYTRPGTFTITLRVHSPTLGYDDTISQRTITVTVLNPVHFMMPAWSPTAASADGKTIFNRIAFVYRDDATPNYYEIRLGTLRYVGSDLKEEFEHEAYFALGTEGRATNLFPSWSPDGTQLVIMSDVGGQRYGTTDLYTIKAGSHSQLTMMSGRSGTAAFPYWARTGEIYFCSNEQRLSSDEPRYPIPGTEWYIAELRAEVVSPVRLYEPFDIFRITLGRTGATQIVSTVGHSSLWPSTDPSGKRLAFSQQGDIYVASTDGLNKDVGVIARTGWPEEYPRWNPKFADWIAFVRYKDGRYQVVVYNLKTKEEAVLTPRVPADVMYPAWSPDGRYLIAQVKKPEGWRLSVWTVLDPQGQLLTLRPEIALKPIAK